MSEHSGHYGDLLKLGLNLYRRNFFKVIFLGLLLAIVAFLPRIIADLHGTDLPHPTHPFSFYSLELILINFLCLIFYIGIIWRFYCVLSGVQESYREDLTIGIRKAPYVLVATILQRLILYLAVLAIFGFHYFFYQQEILFSKNLFGSLFTILAFLAQIFFIIYVSTLFIFLVPLIALENKGIIPAIRRSIALTWKHWWRVFSLQTTPWLGYILALLLIKYALFINIHLYFIERGPHPLSATILNIILFGLFIPLTAAMLVLQLSDLERRNNDISVFK